MNYDLTKVSLLLLVSLFFPFLFPIFPFFFFICLMRIHWKIYEKFDKFDFFSLLFLFHAIIKYTWHNILYLRIFPLSTRCGIDFWSVPYMGKGTFSIIVNQTESKAKTPSVSFGKGGGIIGVLCHVEKGLRLQGSWDLKTNYVMVIWVDFDKFLECYIYLKMGACSEVTSQNLSMLKEILMEGFKIMSFQLSSAEINRLYPNLGLSLSADVSRWNFENKQEIWITMILRSLNL